MQLTRRKGTRNLASRGVSLDRAVRGGWEGEGYSFAACLSNVTIAYASLSRRGKGGGGGGFSVVGAVLNIFFFFFF